MCLPKKKGGLGVKSIALFNKSLLAKWRWRFCSDNSAIWYELLNFIYGASTLRDVGIALSAQQNASWLFKDLFRLEYDIGGLNPWFSNAVSKRVGYGDQVHFWLDKWVGNARLKDLFPMLFQIAVNKNCKIADMGDWVGETWHWRWTWRRPLFRWEEDLFQQLHDCLLQVSPVRHLADSWCWKLDPPAPILFCQIRLQVSNRIAELEAFFTNCFALPTHKYMEMQRSFKGYNIRLEVVTKQVGYKRIAFT